jgi:hypothetical protein
MPGFRSFLKSRQVEIPRWTNNRKLPLTLKLKNLQVRIPKAIANIQQVRDNLQPQPSVNYPAYLYQSAYPVAAYSYPQIQPMYYTYGVQPFQPFAQMMPVPVLVSQMTPETLPVTTVTPESIPLNTSSIAKNDRSDVDEPVVALGESPSDAPSSAEDSSRSDNNLDTVPVFTESLKHLMAGEADSPTRNQLNSTPASHKVDRAVLSSSKMSSPYSQYSNVTTSREKSCITKTNTLNWY